MKILNDGPLPSRGSDPDIAARLRRGMNELKGEFFDLERGRVDYEALRTSEAFRRFAADTALLRVFDPRRLQTRQEKIAFWVNLYNVLVVHGIIALGIRHSVKEAFRFFRRVGYRVGGMSFTPDDVEHGILRGNRPPPGGILRPFSDANPRLPLAVVPPDPRIHFALVCGSLSCPPIQFYTPEEIDRQLDRAAAGFINSPAVEILPAHRRVRLSPLFKWYRDDFGGAQGVWDVIGRHRDRRTEVNFVLKEGSRCSVEWQPYDWSLNA